MFLQLFFFSRSIVFYFFLLFLLVIFLFSNLRSQIKVIEPEDIVDKIKNHYLNVKSMEVKFREYHSSIKLSYGILYVNSPNQYLITYYKNKKRATPYKKIYVNNNKLIVYLISDEIVLEESISTNLDQWSGNQFSHIFDTTLIRQLYYPNFFNSRQLVPLLTQEEKRLFKMSKEELCYHLYLKPKDIILNLPNYYLWVNKNGVLLRVRLVNRVNKKINLLFESFKKNINFPPNFFDFESPAGAQTFKNLLNQATKN